MILSKSYKEVINKIHVDDAMKQRILQNIEQEQRSSSKDNRGEKNIFHYFQYKKFIFYNFETSYYQNVYPYRLL